MRPSIYGGIPQRDDLRPLTEALHARDCDRVQRELQERLAPSEAEVRLARAKAVVAVYGPQEIAPDTQFSTQPLPPRRLPGGVHAWARVRFDEMELAAWEKRDQGEE